MISRGATVARIAKLTSLLTLLFLGLAAGAGNLGRVAVGSSVSSQIAYAAEPVSYAPGELVIGLGTESEAKLLELVKSWNAVVVDQLPEIHAYLVRLDEQRISASLYESAHAGFEYVEFNYYVHSTFTPNDPLWVDQWAPRKVRADMGWGIELGAKSLIVAVIDTGIDYGHNDLAPNYLPLGYDWVNHDPYPLDDNGHGTHVAGIIGAVTNNAVGVAGLAQVSIMAEKVLDPSGTGTVFDVADGVVDAANKGARITNNSYGTYVFSSVMRDAFQYAAQTKGTLNIAGAGNDNLAMPFYPAAFGDFVISVAGTDQNDAKWPDSNHGDWIEFSAPAVSIISTLPVTSYGYLTGTSMASACVAGAAALVWSHFETMSADQVRRRLQETAIDLGAAGRDPLFGYGRVDLFSALSMQAPVGGVIAEPDRSHFSMLGVEAALATIGLASIALLLRYDRRKPNP